jgi:Saxitoxin biosynthesis operon protein SxtJ
MVKTNFFARKITTEQSRDTGMAMVVLLLLLFLARGRKELLFAALVVQVLSMISPRIYRPVAVVWLGLSDILGMFIPKILLGIVFVGVVTPLGLVLRLLGKDPLKLHAFRSGGSSVMVERNHIFNAEDLEKPY